jgi:hypothetical protein
VIIEFQIIQLYPMNKYTAHTFQLYYEGVVIVGQDNTIMFDDVYWPWHTHSYQTESNRILFSIDLGVVLYETSPNSISPIGSNSPLNHSSKYDYNNLQQCDCGTMGINYKSYKCTTCHDIVYQRQIADQFYISAKNIIDDTIHQFRVYDVSNCVSMESGNNNSNNYHILTPMKLRFNCKVSSATPGMQCINKLYAMRVLMIAQYVLSDIPRELVYYVIRLIIN